MMSSGPEGELRGLVAEVAGRDSAEMGLDDDLVRELGLDSLTGLRVLAALEKRFDVRFPDDRLSSIRTLRQLVDAIEEREDEGI